MSRISSHIEWVLPESHPDSPGLACQDGIQEGSSPYVAALQYRATRGWVAMLLAAPCLHAPTGLQRATPSGPPPLAFGHPLRGPLRGRASAFSGSPAQARYRLACAGSVLCTLALLDRLRPLLKQGVNALARLRAWSGAGALPPPQHSALSLRSQLASFLRRLPQQAAACTGLRPNAQTSPAFSLRSQMAGYAGASAPRFCWGLATDHISGKNS
jgi:hypothetical protein